MPVNYTRAENAAVVLDYKGANQAAVKGLNKLKPPGIQNNVVEVAEFRQAMDRAFLSGGKYPPISFGGCYVLGDDDGQDKLKEYAGNRTILTGTDILFFLNDNDFFATDLANDADAGFQISKFDPSEADKNNVFNLACEAVSNGKIATYTAHMTEGATPTLAFVSGSPDTITDSASGFITAGFKVGQSLMIIGSTSNDAVHATITAVAAGTLTLSSDTELTSEAGVEGMELHGGSL